MYTGTVSCHTVQYVQSDYIYKCYDVQGQLIALKKLAYDEV